MKLLFSALLVLQSLATSLGQVNLPLDEKCEAQDIATLYRGSQYSPGVVNILVQDDEYLYYTVSQNFASNGAKLRVVYKNEDGHYKCESFSNEVLPFGHKSSFKSQCVDGFAEIDVYAQDDTNASMLPPQHTSRPGDCPGGWSADSGVNLYRTLSAIWRSTSLATTSWTSQPCAQETPMKQPLQFTLLTMACPLLLPTLPPSTMSTSALTLTQFDSSAAWWPTRLRSVVPMTASLSRLPRHPLQP